ncbi:hypothetical protein [Nocardioides bizhenqiangii]|uniref:Uncharacterized protein n=1 Tax=Nocardioides bizhenqiangii TaxID=3095076 RepID=A0ABZ0ZVK6_9ACTN|nr:hypothetical protein [Nocardioides sp. HM61]WQQ27278.1 hypothetical protein SHK19_03395 [Nocardioides sp. HM61]
MERMSAADRLERHYEEVAECFEEASTGDYGALVVPTGNSDEPMHRWFHLKEAFSYQLLPRVLKDTGLADLKELTVFEPFAGSGTVAATLVQMITDGQLSRASYMGLEANPFLHLLSSAKLAAAQHPPTEFDALAASVVEASQVVDPDSLEAPALATFRSGYFDSDSLLGLLRLRQAIKGSPASSVERRLLMICLAATIEPSSFLRKDGRALRRVTEPRTNDPFGWFKAIAEIVHEDLPRRPVSITGRSHHGDVRDFEVPPTDEAASDLSLFSPPYPNNIDYTEVYKLETWFLNFINSHDEFRAQRRTSLRSHGSLKWQEEYRFHDSTHRREIEDLVSPLLAVIPADRYRSARRQLVLGYVDDMFTTLLKVERCLRKGGQMVCVVGNSLHGSHDQQLLIAADLLIARLSELAGLNVDRLEVARVPTRRRSASRFLRETAIFASKPASE